MGQLRALAAALFVTAAIDPAGAATPAPAGSAVPVVISATVAEGAGGTMTPGLWQRLIGDYVGGRVAIAADEGAALDDARCRAEHGLYALRARFEAAPWLPGLARDPARTYALVRLEVRNCITGTLLPAHVISIDGDPLATAKAGDPEGNAERLWARPARSALGRGPLLRPLARIVAIRGGVALLEHASPFADDEVLHAVADGQGRARPPFELTVIDAHGRLLAARISGAGEPHVGDYVAASADPLITPWPAAHR